MTTVQTSSIARGAIIARLADETSGFNPRFLAGIAALGLTLPASFRTPISFAAGSKNFFTVDLEPADFGKSSAYTLPLMTLFPMSTDNQRLERPRQFAGLVTHGLKLFLTWPSTRAATELTPLAEAAQDALISTFNDLDLSIANWAQAWADLNTDANLVYGGDIAVQFSRLIADGDSWSIGISARIMLDVFTQ